MKDNIGYRKPHQRRGEAAPQKMRETTPPVVGWTQGVSCPGGSRRKEGSRMEQINYKQKEKEGTMQMNWVKCIQNLSVLFFFLQPPVN